MLGCRSTLFNMKRTFKSKYPQLQVAKDFAVAEKKLHLTISRRKYNPGKKAPKKRRTSNGKTAAPKPSLQKYSHKVSLSLNNNHKASHL